MTNEILNDQINGLVARLAQLRQTERIMLEAVGLEKQVAKEKANQPDIDARIQGAKEELSEVQAEQARIVNEAFGAFTVKMDEALPEGNVTCNLTEDKVEIGWNIGGALRPFRALSGGERIAFDMALAYALGAGVIVKEVAELDDRRLALVLEKFGELTTQVIIVTCHAPAEVPPPWSVIHVA